MAVVQTPEDAMVACRANGSYIDGRPVRIGIWTSERRPAGAPRAAALVLDQADDAPSLVVTSDELQNMLLQALKGRDSGDIWTAKGLARRAELGPSNDKSLVRGAMSQMVELLAEHPELLVELHPRLFEHLVAALLSYSGYQEVNVSIPSADGGVDIYAARNTGSGRLLFVLQCKRYSLSRKVTRPEVQLLYGVLAASDATRAAVVTTSTFTEPAQEFLAKKQHHIGGIDAGDLRVWLQATSQALHR